MGIFITIAIIFGFFVGGFSTKHFGYRAFDHKECQEKYNVYECEYKPTPAKSEDREK